MTAVIFEVWPGDGKLPEYLDIAARLRPLLDEIDGFISIERFGSLAQQGKILSLSFWRDEESGAKSRRREAQARGWAEVFKDYRLRIAGVVRDYGMLDRARAPSDSRAAHSWRVSASR